MLEILGGYSPYRLKPGHEAVTCAKVVAAVAGEPLSPGQYVTVGQELGGSVRAFAAANPKMADAIVDPFLPHAVPKGETFLAVFIPNRNVPQIHRMMWQAVCNKINETFVNRN